MKNYHTHYGFKLEDVKKFKNIKVLHPGPANIGFEIDEDLMRSEFYLGNKQVEASIVLRQALIEKMT